ncbi:MAG: tRNA (adenosine(37)-N6)-threonylcarbamoyltransferase complex transferase subunit TsaD [Coriobacteriia bacterium]
MRVRALTRKDLDDVLAIERASFADPWSEDLFAQELGREDRIWLAAEEGTRVVGYAGVMITGAEADLMDIAVAQERRRRGIARSLLWGVARMAAERDVQRLTLEVRPSNVEALGLYASCGFDQVGRRAGYYPETREDALIWRSRPLAPVLAAMDAAARGEDVVLAIETSCDETAVSVMRGGREELASVVASQVDFHARFGGVVPEIASRKHAEAIVAVADEALAKAGVGTGDVHGIAVTQGPGLVGALVVGIAYAKGLALAQGLPLVGVNHLEGHIYAARLLDPDLEPPLVALLVSGGHTMLAHVPEWGRYEVLGRTLDDAVGEAFDKVAKLLGLGYPGGPVISRLAAQGDPSAIPFPRAMIRSGNLDVSLSGLKTAVIQHVEGRRAVGAELAVADIAASFQAAVIDVQVAKALQAAREHRVSAVVLAGGVAANTALREALREALAQHGIRLSVPPFGLCTDNASMIAAVAHDHLKAGRVLGLTADALPNMRLGG